MKVSEMMIIVPAVIIAFAIIVVGIYGHGKRVDIYEKYRPYFGPFKAYLFLTFILMGFIMMIGGIAGMFELSNPEMQLTFAGQMGQSFMGAAFIAVGIVIAVLANNKARINGEGNIIGSMVVAGCGTVWHIELIILQICCFVWLFRLIFRRR